MNTKLYVATSTAVINKPKFNQKAIYAALAKNWINQELSVSELAEHIANGNPFCAQHNGDRKGNNFIRTNTVTVDIDKGMTLDEVLKHDLVKNFSTIVYTTSSHTPDHHRVRAIFRTDRMIEKEEDMRAAHVGIIRTLGGDGACKDACRMWFGSKDCEMHKLDNTLPSLELDKLIALGGEKSSPKITYSINGQVKSSFVATNRVMVPVEAIEFVKDACDGSMVRLDSLASGTAIHCPMHDDRRPSAIVTRNKIGVHGVYCSSCAFVFWPKGTEFKRAEKRFDFNSVSTFVRQKAEEELPHDDLTNEDDGGNIIEPTEAEIDAWKAEMDSRSYIHTSSQFVPDLPMTDGITFLASSKGSGKTQWIEKIVNEAKSENKSVLLIGHRQSLLQSMSNRVGLICYFRHEQGKMKNNDPSKYYAICLDSMVKLLNPSIDKYDIIIIDESEQVIGHTTQQTLAERRRQTITMLAHYLNVAKSVIYCDADLGAITIEFAYQMANNESRFRFVLNEYNANSKSIDLYENHNHLIDDLVDTIYSGGRHYVATNSRTKANELNCMVSRIFPDLKVRLITSDQATDPDTQNFIANIKKEILSYDLVIASPSLGTGVDITFKDNAQYIDTVFGFFEPNVTTHFEIDQQLSRVRHPKKIKAWITPERFNFESDASAIASELINSKIANDALIGYKRDGGGIYDEKYLSIFSQVTSIRRASLNSLLNNFSEYKKHLGWNVNVIGPNVDSAKNGKIMIDSAKEELVEINQNEVFSAKEICVDKYEELQDQQKTKKLSKSDKNSMRRFELESFYRQPISKELIQLDNKGRFRDVVRNAEFFFMDDSEFKDRASREANSEGVQELFTADLKNIALKRTLLKKLLKAAGLIDVHRSIDTKVEITGSAMGRFIDEVRTNKSKLEELFNISCPTDIDSKPISMVGKLLSLIGLSLLNSRSEKVKEKGKIRYYMICPFSFVEIHGVIDKRMVLDSNAFLNGP